ncbi:MAG TPA: protein-L-isoaspartate(D-aspartate) O-methyltransferase [Clostridia bacterium]|nr:protein-L-isoaspartate(D-aspartate) O-methyltransferase [Clostridia bacterium]
MDWQEMEKCFSSLQRSFFVDGSMQKYADLDMPLPIGFGQTISQPSLVLQMTRLLAPEKNSRVLEIGTGSGFQTALLAKMAREVYTVERIPELMAKAKKRLEALDLTNIYFKVGDGSKGWEEHAPYDRIMVTAAARVVPAELIQQLAEGGRMVIPVGPRESQELKLVIRTAGGGIQVETVERVRFVELKGEYGWSKKS